MKILISTVTIVLMAFILCPAETTFPQTGGSPQKSQPPKVFKPSKQKQPKIKGKTNRGQSRYRYVELTNSTTKRKYRGKVDLSKVPRVVFLKEIN